MMVNWPPQPCVEDEIASLEHEQISPKMAAELRSDDDPAVSRGAVDQYPILVDTDNERVAGKCGPDREAKRKGNAEATSSDDGAGPSTPPFTHRQPSSKVKAETGSREKIGKVHATMSEVPIDIKDASRGRPLVARIDTTQADLDAMAMNNRRVPSPYAFSRPSTKTHDSTPPSDSLSTPAQKTRPVPDQSTGKMPFSPNLSSEVRAVLSDEPDVSGRDRRRHRSKSRARSRSHPRERSLRRQRQSSRRYTNETSSEDDLKSHQRSRRGIDAPKRRPERESFTPPYSRRQSRESSKIATCDDVSKHALRYERDAPVLLDSPYISSTDDTGRRSRLNNKMVKDRRESQHRPSVQRKERPHLDNFSDISRLRYNPKQSADDSVLPSKESSRQGHLNPGAPLTADAAKSMEDVFEKAFRENHSRQVKVRPAHRGNSSVLASPATSPPRTPRSERHSREYFEIDETLQRSVQRSRPPSIDDGQLSVLRSHASLLSAATAGAAVAAWASSDQSHSSLTGSTPRSRRPSPVLEERVKTHRSDATAQGENSRTIQGGGQISDHRPLPGSSPRGDEPPLQLAPQRTASYSAQEQPKSILKSTSTSSRDGAHGYTASPTTYSPSSNQQFPVLSAQSAASICGLRLSSCPRFRPVSGYNDWTSIKEMSDLDICPTCVSALRTACFSHQLIPSLPRPYRESSVCAMSRPWIRIAILRAHRQRDSTLSYLRTLYKPPAGTRPCAGNQPDTRNWFDIVDPSTREIIPNFFACSACVWAVDSIFPELRHLLDRPKSAVSQEKICSLHSESKHFSTFIDEFEQAAVRCRGREWRSSDVQPLTNTIRRACRFKECCRDRLLPIRTWHFMPELPEFTICEECYAEFVWPISDRPIARDISKTTKVVPTRRDSSSNVGISCQLYSERMRNLFKEATVTRDLARLRDVAKTRQSAQLRLMEMKKLYEADQKYGIDRRVEIERNDAIWRNLE